MNAGRAAARALVALVSVMFTLGVASAGAQVAPPPPVTPPPPVYDGDDRDAPLYVYDGYVARGSNASATAEDGEPDHAGVPGGHSIWFEAWVPAGVPVVFESCGSDFDTALAVYANSYGDLQELDSNDDSSECGPSGTGSMVRFTPTTSTSVLVAIDGKNGATGNYAVRMMSNDERGGAVYLGSGYTQSFSSRFATQGADEAGRAVWFREYASAGQKLIVDTCQTAVGGIDSVMTVYSEGYGGLVELATNDDTIGCGPGGVGSRIETVATGYGSILIAVHGKGDTTGEFTVSYVETPANDDRANAQQLPTAPGYGYYGTTLGATREDGEPEHGGHETGSVWYRWAPNPGRRTVTICDDGSSIQPIVAVYTESYGGLTEVASDVAEPGGPTYGDSCATAAFTATSGTTYFIAVAAVAGTDDSFNMTFGVPNDDFASAEPFSNYANGTTVGATAEPNEPAHAGTAATRSVWYRYTPTTSDPLRVGVEACSYTTSSTHRIAVYTGSTVGELTPVASSTGDAYGCGSSGGARVSWLRPSTSSTVSYWVAIDTAGDSGAYFSLRRTYAPTNDDRANAEEIGQYTTASTPYGSTVEASREAGEPDHAGAAGTASVWYRWTPAYTNTVQFDLCQASGNLYDTALAVYTSGYGGLQEVTSSDDSEGCGDGRQSRVTFTAQSGTTYYIAVDGRNGARGSFHLRQRTRPGNDNRANAYGAGTYGSSFGWLDLATAEPGEPDHAGVPGGHSVWFRWTPGGTGPATIDTCSTYYALDTTLAIYTSGDGALQEIESNDDAAGCGTGGVGSRVSFTATGGTTYFIAVDGKNGAVGDFTLSVPPNHDHFAGARVVTDAYPYTEYHDLSKATAEPGEPAHAGAPASRSVWYDWRPPRTALATVETCQPDNYAANGRAGVYSGDVLTELTTVPTVAGSACPTGTQGSRIRFDATKDASYKVALDAAGASTYAYIQRRLAPANDRFDQAEDLGTSASTFRTGSIVDAGRDAGEADHAGAGGIASVWYRWTPPRSGTGTASTCGFASYDTALAVYADGYGGLQEVAASDDAPGCSTRSHARWRVAAGTIYWIAVTGKGQSTGGFDLSTRLGPINDDLAVATAISAGGWSGTTVDAGDQAGEPDHGGAGGDRSTWWRFNLDGTRNATVRVCATGGGPLPIAAVYAGATGAAFDALTTTGTVTTVNGCRLVTLRARAGNHFLAVDGAQAGEQSSYSVTLSIAPPNDDRAQAQTVSSYGAEPSYFGTTAAATPEDGEPLHAGQTGGRSVWYRFTPSASGPTVLEVCDAAFDALLAVYTEDGEDLIEVASNDDAVTDCAGGKSRVVLANATASTTYYIAVDGADDEGSFRLRLSPYNDHLGQAAGLYGQVDSETGSTLRATAEVGEPAHVLTAAARTVWYQWTPSYSGRATISTCLASTAVTRIGVYTGTTIGALTSVGQSGPVEGCASGNGARVRLRVVGGTTYRIAVDQSAPGTFTAMVALAPANDDRADARTASVPSLQTGSTDYATPEDDEPAHAGHAASGSVWFRITAPADGPLALKTCGSSFATVLAVYETDGTPVASSDNGTGTCGASSGRAGLTFDAVGGRAYDVALDGLDGATGAYELAVGSPPNDDIEDATVLTGEHVSAVGDNRAATKQTTEPAGIYPNGARSLWWQWTAPSTGSIEINTCGSDYAYPVLEVFSGAISSLTLVASSTTSSGCGSLSRLTLAAQSGVTYRIRVSPYYTSSLGKIRLQIGPPANDRFANAETVTGLTADLAGTIAGASREDNEPSISGGDGRTVWYAWTAPQDGRLVLDTCGSPTAAKIGLWRGTALGALTTMSPSGDQAACPAESPGTSITVPVDAGLAYRFAIDGTSGAAGEISARLRLLVDETPPVTTIDTAPPARTNANPLTFTFSADELATFECALDDTTYATCTSPVTRHDIADGEHVFRVRATDQALNVDPDPAEAAFTVDRTPPPVAIDAAPAEVGRETAGSITFSSTEVGATFECSLDGATYAVCSSPFEFTDLPDGTHTFGARALDDLENRSTPAPAVFRVDTTPPVSSFSAGPPTATNSTDAHLEFASNEGGSTLDCSLDEAEFAPCSSPRDLDSLDEGAHAFAVRATDAAGNVETTPATRTWTVDLTAPETTVSDGPTGPVHRPFAYTFGSDDPQATVRCRLDEGVFFVCGPIDPADLSVGDHTLRVAAVDPAGNEDPSPEELTFSVANAAPQASIVVAPPAGPAPHTVEATLTGLDEDEDTLGYSVDWGDETAPTAGTLPRNTPLSHQYDDPGSYAVTLTVEDAWTQDAATATVAVSLGEPLAARAGDDVVVEQGQVVRFDGGDSRPSAGIDSFAWTFGDGANADGKVTEHSYAGPGIYEARLTVANGDETSGDSRFVRVVAPSADGLNVAVRSAGAPLEDVDLVVIDADGRRYSDVSDATGSARLLGLPNGAFSMYAYKQGYRAEVVPVIVAEGSGTASVDLQPGEVVAASITSRPLTLDEIVARGIDPNDPDNQHVYEFTVNLDFDGVLRSHKGTVSEGGFIGGGCSPSRCAYAWDACMCRVVTTSRMVDGHPMLTSLVIPFRASWLKEFFDVSMVVQNLAPAGFTLRDGQAALAVPDGLVLAPTASPQSSTVPVGDIGGGESRAISWTVRGDDEGEYDLAASYSGRLDPVGRSVQIRAETVEPLKVWGGSALELTVEVDDEGAANHPYKVRVGMKNVADVHVYNPAVELLRTGRHGYIEQPGQQHEFATRAIAPGDTFWTADYILVPSRSGLVDLGESFVRKTAGDVAPVTKLVTRERVPAVDDDPELRGFQRSQSSLLLEWQPIPDAVGYRIYRTEDVETDDFASTPVKSLGAGQHKAILLGVDLDAPGASAYAVSAVLPGGQELRHPVFEVRARESGREAPHTETQDVTACGQYDGVIKLSFSDPEVPLESWSYQTGTGTWSEEFELPHVTAQRQQPIVQILRFRRDLTEQQQDVFIRVRNTGGEQSTTREVVGQCDYVALGDSYSSGEGAETSDYFQNSNEDDTGLEIGNHCHQSQKAFAFVVAEISPIVSTPKFVACSGAVIADLSNDNQKTQNQIRDYEVRAQYNALSSATRLVTLSIGGNDTYFDDVIKTCIIDSVLGAASTVVANFVTACKPTWASTVDAAMTATINRLPGVVNAIKAKTSPNARVIFVSYPPMFDKSGLDSCHGVSVNDQRWIRSKQDEFNQRAQAAVTSAGAEFVDVTDRFRARELCSGFAEGENSTGDWINGLVPSNPEHSFHPNPAGHAAMAAGVLEQLDASIQTNVKTVSPGATIVDRYPVPPFQRWLSAVINYPGSDVKLSLVSPSGRVIDRTTTAPDVEHLGHATGESLRVSDPEPGEWEIRLFGADVASNGEPVHLSTTVAPKIDGAPIAIAQADDPGGKAPRTIRFDATASYDLEGPVAAYRWDFGDGTTDSGVTAAHDYRSDGEFTPRLTVQDAAGSVDEFVLPRVVVESESLPPVEAPKTTAQDGGVSVAPPGGDTSRPDPYAFTAVSAKSRRTASELRRALRVALIGISARARYDVSVTAVPRRGARFLLGRTKGVASASGRLVVTVRPTRSALRRLRRARIVSLRVRARGSGSSIRSVDKTITIRVR